MVLRELKRVGLPSLDVQVQPAGKTLVNFDTIFYTRPHAFTRTLQILGRSVQVRATPTRYQWDFGDGQGATTEQPGNPYPSKDIVHRYADAATTVHPSVDVVYTARFRVAGGAWQDIPETLTIPGRATDLRITEATPLLSGQRS